jgi:hypothetical protein
MRAAAVFVGAKSDDRPQRRGVHIHRLGRHRLSSCLFLVSFSFATTSSVSTNRTYIILEKSSNLKFDQILRKNYKKL